jgi:hypothetical protein
MPSATLAPTSSAPSTIAAPPSHATDDEILGIVSPRNNPPRNTQQRVIAANERRTRQRTAERRIDHPRAAPLQLSCHCFQV